MEIKELFENIMLDYHREYNTIYYNTNNATTLYLLKARLETISCVKNVTIGRTNNEIYIESEYGDVIIQDIKLTKDCELFFLINTRCFIVTIVHKDNSNKIDLHYNYFK